MWAVSRWTQTWEAHRRLINKKCLYTIRGVLCTLLSPAEMAEPIVAPFGRQALVGPENHVLVGGMHTGTTWRMQLNDRVRKPVLYCSCSVALCQITLITCYCWSG